MLTGTKGLGLEVSQAINFALKGKGFCSIFNDESCNELNRVTSLTCSSAKISISSFSSVVLCKEACDIGDNVVVACYVPYIGSKSRGLYLSDFVWRAKTKGL